MQFKPPWICIQQETGWGHFLAFLYSANSRFNERSLRLTDAIEFWLPKI